MTLIVGKCHCPLGVGDGQPQDTPQSNRAGGRLYYSLTIHRHVLVRTRGFFTAATRGALPTISCRELWNIRCLVVLCGSLRQRTAGLLCDSHTDNARTRCYVATTDGLAVMWQPHSYVDDRQAATYQHTDSLLCSSHGKAHCCVAATGRLNGIL